MRPGEIYNGHNELAYQIWDQYYQRFVCKCTETAQPIIGQEMARIQAKHDQKLIRGGGYKPISSVPL